MAEKGASTADKELYEYIESWKVSNTPLRILICGRGGVGKSTLTNNLLKLNLATTDTRGRATTESVVKHEYITERGIKVCIFDTPGFGDIRTSDEEIVRMMRTKTNNEVHLVLYCIKLDGTSRVTREDQRALQLLQIFSKKIWENMVIVLTCANLLHKIMENETEYKSVVQNVKGDIQQVLRNVGVSEAVIEKIPIVVAGDENPDLPGIKNWEDELFLTVLQCVDPKVLPSLLQLRFTFAELITAGLLATAGGVLGGMAAGPVGAAAGVGATTAVTTAGGAIGSITFATLYGVIKYKFKESQSKKKLASN